MARYDVYALNGGLVVDVQADILDHYSTCVVVPLVPTGEAPPALKRLHPAFEIAGQKYVLATHLMAAASKDQLVRRDQNLARHHDQIVSALDMLFQGF